MHMAFEIHAERRPTTSGRDGKVYILQDSSGQARADIWPGLGFNCFRWQAVVGGQPVELLYADPELFPNGRATRSGIPVLFPFPNRIREGRFHWQDRDYQLPLNESSGLHAIHGFVASRAFRVVGQGANDQAAFLTGEFVGSRDGRDVHGLWPADYRLRLTVRLSKRKLRLETHIDNPDKVPLPFGIGFHPYFRLPMIGNTPDGFVEAPARSYWELQEHLPTGKKLPIDPNRDINEPRLVSTLDVDDVFTDLEGPTVPDNLRYLGSVRKTPTEVRMRLSASPSFRELVVFTPPHRQAICLEPYTCTTDALNLQEQRQIDAGLLVLEPGSKWSGVVEMEI
jgi:aldose 1-epimerase